MTRLKVPLYKKSNSNNNLVKYSLIGIAVLVALVFLLNFAPTGKFTADERNANPSTFNVGDKSYNPDHDGDGVSDAIECPNLFQRTDTDGDGISSPFIWLTATISTSDGSNNQDDNSEQIIDNSEITNEIKSGSEEVSVAIGSITGSATSIAPTDSADAVIAWIGKNCPDSDNDGIADIFDDDDDNDGILTANEDTNADGDPTNDDTDNDGYPNYLDDDSDNDGLLDADEVTTHLTNPYSNDTDSDGIPDKWEIDNNLLPTVSDSSDDPDGDGVMNVDEYSCPMCLVAQHSDPHNEDTDGDFEIDGSEMNLSPITDPTDITSFADTDSDNLPDAWELKYVYTVSTTQLGKYSQNGDFDSDGLTDYYEFLAQTAPDNADTDDDGINDALELAWDGIPKFYVAGSDTDPNNPDSDNDGFCDGSGIVSGVCEAGEDLNNNGAIDLGETDPLDASSIPPDQYFINFVNVPTSVTAGQEYDIQVDFCGKNIDLIAFDVVLEDSNKGGVLTQFLNLFTTDTFVVSSVEAESSGPLATYSGNLQYNQPDNNKVTILWNLAGQKSEDVACNNKQSVIIEMVFSTGGTNTLIIENAEFGDDQGNSLTTKQFDEEATSTVTLPNVDILSPSQYIFISNTADGTIEPVTLEGQELDDVNTGYLWSLKIKGGTTWSVDHSTRTSTNHLLDFNAPGEYTLKLETGSGTETTDSYITVFYRLGDANDDGDLTIADVTKAERYYLQLDTGGETEVLDANMDGSFSALDISYIEYLDILPVCNMGLSPSTNIEWSDCVQP